MKKNWMNVREQKDVAAGSKCFHWKTGAENPDIRTVILQSLRKKRAGGNCGDLRRNRWFSLRAELKE